MSLQKAMQQMLRRSIMAAWFWQIHGSYNTRLNLEHDNAR